MDDVTRREMLTSAVAVGAAATFVAVPDAAAAGQTPAAPPPPGWTEEELKDRKRVLTVGFTEDEADAWLLLNRGVAKILGLPVIHPTYNDEIVEAAHALQSALMMRPAYRKYRELGPKGKSGSVGLR